ncbi:MAG: hypothetical protein FJZ43_01385 [Candidatus Staskawiczbacteria bacterium]|nr:hypothetical protein [Candidatus Staskawiczbacteria bacterium]
MMKDFYTRHYLEPDYFGKIMWRLSQHDKIGIQNQNTFIAMLSAVKRECGISIEELGYYFDPASEPRLHSLIQEPAPF